MDNFNNSEPALVHQQPFNINKYISKLSEKWYLVLASLAIAIIIAFCVNRYSSPVYRVETSAIIKASNEVNNPVYELLYGDEAFGRTSMNLENEAYLLKSKTLIKRTLIDLDQNVTYYKPGKIRMPETTNSPIVVQIDTASLFIPYNRLLKCSVLNDETFELSFEDEGFFQKLTSIKPDTVSHIFDGLQFKFNQDIYLYGFNFRIGLLKNGFRGDAFFTLQSYNKAAKGHRERINISPLSPESSILTIEFETTHPGKGKRFSII